MGLAASQARLLSLTARIHDVEYQAQMIQSAKLALALQEDEVYRKYNEALDATTLTYQDMQGNRIAASFNNLCGEGSIKNNIAGNKNYVFRDGDYNLIVPSDIYDAYNQFNGTDPYAFAMYMMMGEEAYNTPSTENPQQTIFAKAEEDYFNSMAEDTSSFSAIREKMDTLLNKIYNHTTSKEHNESSAKTGDIETMKECLQLCNWNNFLENFTQEELSDKDLKEDLDSLKKVMEEYKFNIYRGGKAMIYSQVTGEDKTEFDNDKFNYYLRWAKLIEEEQGIDYCTKASSYTDGFENDPELLNQMLESGRITIDAVSVDNKGRITDSTTSASSDSNIAFTNKASIDNRELKKAEAEYEHAMKQINKKDKQYDMDLNRLETERTALTTEYDSVKQVIKDNIERTFGIFS